MGLTGAAVLLMISFYIRDPLLAMLAMGLASFFNDTTLPGSWAACMDVGGKYAGTVSGSMNMLGNFGGMAGPVVVGYILSPLIRPPRTGSSPLSFSPPSISLAPSAGCSLTRSPRWKRERRR